MGEGHGREDARDDQRAPIFLQFVDALWQITRQHPTAFEFNDRVLAALADHSYSGAFGTFLMDCEADRASAGFACAGGSLSLWDVLLNPATRASYVNPLFVAPGGGGGAMGGSGSSGSGSGTPAASATPLLPSRAHFLPLLTDVRDVQVWPRWVLVFQ